jgi:transcriptional regulator with XRE-family HTH domain
MDMTSTFGIWLKRRRKALDLTQSELAQLAGCSTVAVRKIEAGTLRPSKQLAELLAEHLAIAPEERCQFVHMAREAALPEAFETLPALPVEGRAGNAGDAPACPYRGDYPFHEPDAPWFYGRERMIEQLVSELRERSLLALAGPPGSGKTSLVSAGLLPRLRAMTAPRWWLVTTHPGRRPFHELAAALLPHLTTTGQLVQARALAGALGAGQVSLADVVERLLAHHAAADRVLLLVDQFEELFALCAAAGLRQCYSATLLEAAGAGLTTVVLVLRSQALAALRVHGSLAHALADATLVLEPLTRDEARGAIERPALGQGVSFEEGLVERVLDDFDPGGAGLYDLTSLQRVLTELWCRQVEQGLGALTHAAYDEVASREFARRN